MGHAKIKYGDGQVHDEKAPRITVAVEYLLKQLTNLGIVKEFNELRPLVTDRGQGEFFKDSAVTMMM